jgi:hypothetical protein
VQEQLSLFTAPQEPTGQQHRDILMHLRMGNSLTVVEALERFGCYALSQRIGDLKRLGWEIKTEIIKTDTGKHIARYFFEGV